MSLHLLSRSKIWACALAVGLVTSGTVIAGNITVPVTVQATSGPWDQTLNPAFNYGSGDNLAPTIVNAADGFDFTAGNTLTLTYVSGLTSSFFGVPPTVDANGYAGGVFKDDDPGSSGNGFPSKYMGPYPPDVWLNELVGTFADAAGHIVGNPFAIGDGPTALIIPAGAAQLQLGVNDDIYVNPTGPNPDNTGSLVIDVAGPAPASTPEPGTLTLLGIGIVGMAGYGWRRRNKKAQPY